ncbi:cryptochrome/photolyase family protein [Sphingobium naphthae]|nr:cryptochrome/photolyase family protein [Sphingobium naphthae]
MTDGPLLIPVLGDQLTPDIAALRAADKKDSIVLMMEASPQGLCARQRFGRHNANIG